MADHLRLVIAFTTADSRFMNDIACCCCCCCRPGTERFRYAYVWRTLMKAGVHVAGGSDAPVEAPTPLIGMADVTWRHQNGSEMAGGCFFFGGG